MVALSPWINACSPLGMRKNRIVNGENMGQSKPVLNQTWRNIHTAMAQTFCFLVQHDNDILFQWIVVLAFFELV
jgi:hypothetical protein